MIAAYKFKLMIVFISSILMTAALDGCLTGNYGRLQSNRDVTKAFQTLEILPDHKYYYRGAFSSPSVIAGIHTDFRLNLKLWVEIDPQSEDFKALVQKVSLQGMSTGEVVQPWGFKILDHAGNYVGIWYSALRTAAVQVNENNEIVNLSPSGLVTMGKQP
jgi:hypothetical protein